MGQNVATEPFLAFVECAGCGETFEVRSRYALAKAKWCSERCRKRQYQRPCATCGKPCGGSDKSTYCAECGRARGVQAARVRAENNPTRALVERLWAEGYSGYEVTKAAGSSSRYMINRWRQLGWNLPHRRSPEQVQRITEARWGVRHA